jgi:Fe-S oxidoreductase
MKYYFMPGCGYMIYNPGLIDKVMEYLGKIIPGIERYDRCCRTPAMVEPNSLMVTLCIGCYNRFRRDYPELNLKVRELWEVLSEDNGFRFPDYGKMKVNIFDSCSTEHCPHIQESVRVIAGKMNLSVEEYKKDRTKTICCGMAKYNKVSNDIIKDLIRITSSEIPLEHVVTYCPSCMKAMSLGGKKAYFMLEMLFQTPPGVSECDIDKWNNMILDYRTSLSKT